MESAGQGSGTGTSVSKFIPLRADPMTVDVQNDGKRLASMQSGWSRKDELLANYHRQIEENVRMLAGQQLSLYHPVLRRWLEVSEWMSADERRWRQRPVYNRLLPWFIITHARMTENPPVVTFSPGPDRIDAELAEVMDTSFKTLWKEIGMSDAHDRVMAWVVCAGRGHLYPRIDLNRGPIKKWIGEASLPMYETDESGQQVPVTDPESGEPVMMEGVPDIPHDAQGNPLAVGVGPDGPMIPPGAKPHEEREGVLRVDVLSPLNCRGSWGPTPWHEKAEHWIRTYHTPEEVYDLTGLELEPDVRGAGVSDVGEMERILYGTGFFGSVDGVPGLQSQPTSTEGYVELTQRWLAPSGRREGMQETADSPGGRFTLATRKAILIDGARPAAFPYTSPLSTFEFVRLPGRPHGSTPQEALNPVQRAHNDSHARIKEHVNLLTNPKSVIDAASGIKANQFTNAPGENYVVTRRPNVPAIEFVQAPQLGADVYKQLELQTLEFDVIGQLPSKNEGIPKDASGELIKELRFDDDRFLGPTVRRGADEYGRHIQNWMVLLPLIWDEQKILSYAGDDNVARTKVVMPYMFEKGMVNVIPDVESMLPEGRGEKQKQVLAQYNLGLLDGPPGTPEAIKKFYELAHFPHMSRTSKPGGIDRVTAEQENGRLVQGEPPESVNCFEWYNHEVHLGVHENFMKSPEFLRVPPQIQLAFVMHRQAHMMAMQVQMEQALAQAAQQQSVLNPQPPGGGGKPGGGGGKVPPNDRSIRPGPPATPRSLGPGQRMPTQLQPAPSL